MKLSRRNLPLLLLHAREAALAHFRPILKRFGLTDQQWRVLRMLSEARDGLEPGQIAEACKIQKPSLTGILSRMAEMKLIDRDRSQLDQRRQRISLTASSVSFFLAGSPARHTPVAYTEPPSLTITSWDSLGDPGTSCCAGTAASGASAPACGLADCAKEGECSGSAASTANAPASHPHPR